jgi:AcrR family transcriptional regulator
MKQKRRNTEGYVMELYNNNESLLSIADQVGLSVRSLYRIISKKQNLHKHILKDYCDFWRTYVEEGKDIPFNEMMSFLRDLTLKYQLREVDQTAYYINKAINIEIQPVEFLITKEIRKMFLNQNYYERGKEIAK